MKNQIKGPEIFANHISQFEGISNIRIKSAPIHTLKGKNITLSKYSFDSITVIYNKWNQYKIQL